MQYSFEEGLEQGKVPVYDKLSHCLLHARKHSREIERSCVILAKLDSKDKYAVEIGIVNLGGYFLDPDKGYVRISDTILAKHYTNRQGLIDVAIECNPDMTIAELEEEIQDYLPDNLTVMP